MDMLPTEVLLRVFSHVVDGRTLLEMRRVCKRWRGLLVDPEAWRGVELDFGRHPDEAGRVLLRAPYVRRLRVDGVYSPHAQPQPLDRFATAANREALADAGGVVVTKGGWESLTWRGRAALLRQLWRLRDRLQHLDVFLSHGADKEYAERSSCVRTSRPRWTLLGAVAAQSALRSLRLVATAEGRRLRPYRAQLRGCVAAALRSLRVVILYDPQRALRERMVPHVLQAAAASLRSLAVTYWLDHSDAAAAASASFIPLLPPRDSDAAVDAVKQAPPLAFPALRDVELGVGFDHGDDDEAVVAHLRLALDLCAERVMPALRKVTFVHYHSYQRWSQLGLVGPRDPQRAALEQKCMEGVVKGFLEERPHVDVTLDLCNVPTKFT